LIFALGSVGYAGLTEMLPNFLTEGGGGADFKLNGVGVFKNSKIM